jgi:truncated hemoglobin YjbI
MDFLDTVTQSGFDAMTSNPTATGILIGCAALAAVIAAWRYANPARTEQPAPEPTVTAGHRRSDQMRTDNAPAPGTYVSITAPPINDQGVNAYDQLGAGVIRAATDQFYNSVQSDPRLAVYFPLDSIGHLKRHLPLLVGQLLGGPIHYENPVAALRDSHQKLGISPTAYSLLAAHLNTVLYNLRVSHEIRIFLMAQLIKVEDLVIAEALQPA